MRKVLLLLIFVSLVAAQQGERSAKWVFETGDYIVASPVIRDDVLFISSASGNFYALNSTTGTLIWQYGKVGKIESTAALSDKMVFFGSNDGNLYALWMNGSLAWSYKSNDKVTSSPAVSDSMVFFGSNDGNLYALWMNGSLAWSYKTGEKILSSPLFAYGVVYVGSTDGNFYAFEAAKGKSMWNYSGFSSFSSSPLASNWVIYEGSDEEMVYAFHAFNGSILWSQKFPGKIQSSFSISPQNVLYFPCKDGNIYAVYAGDGSKLWSIATGTEAQSSVHYSSETGHVYFGTTDYSVYAADTKGNITWKYPTGNWVISTPTTGNGLLYVGSYDGNIYAVSTIQTEFQASHINVNGSPVTIHGQAFADSVVKQVEVRVNEGSWAKAQGTGNWSYFWDTSSLNDGDYSFEARSLDANGNYELQPYAHATVNFTKKIVLKRLNVSFPDMVMVGMPVKFEVKDSDGKPVPIPQLTILGKTYTGDSNGVIEKDENGNLITFNSDGEFIFTVSKEGYEPSAEMKLKVLKVFDMLPYILASLVLPLVILIPLAYFILKKLRGMGKKR